MTYEEVYAKGTLEPVSTGAWQCTECGLYFDGGVSYWMEGLGPYCPICWTGTITGEIK